jgi:hypothetical protein
MQHRSTLKHFSLLVFWLAYSPSFLFVEGKMSDPLANVKTVSLKGTVIAVDVFLGKGPGSFSMKTAEGRDVTIVLGSVRYIIQKGFNLSAGDSVEAKVFTPDDGTEVKRFVAIEVRNLTQDKILHLRDEKLRPLWRGRKF